MPDSSAIHGKIQLVRRCWSRNSIPLCIDVCNSWKSNDPNISINNCVAELGIQDYYEISQIEYWKPNPALEVNSMAVTDHLTRAKADLDLSKLYINSARGTTRPFYCLVPWATALGSITGGYRGSGVTVEGLNNRLHDYIQTSLASAPGRYGVIMLESPTDLILMIVCLNLGLTP